MARSSLRPTRVMAPVAVLLALGACSRPGATAREETAEDSTTALASADSADARWASIRSVFGMEGKAEDGYFRIDLPRKDLSVTLSGAKLETGFELTSFFGFVPSEGKTVTALGELVLTQEEVIPAVAEARRQGVVVLALHNHLIGETPRLMYMHLMTSGPADSVAARLRALAALTGTPLTEENKEPSAADWSAVDAVLGKHTDAEGKLADYVFARKDEHVVQGMRVRSSEMLETSSEVIFQDLGNGQVANTGELWLLPTEVEPVLTALEAAGMHVSAVHTHTLREDPQMFWVHWSTTGDPATLARGAAAAIAHMNSAQKAAPEKGES